ncbi:MAG: hypothetical protein AAB392_00555 [Patescibacteria group bacterium]
MRYSLVNEFWGGFCPECTEPKDMVLNTDDNWECPNCHLQIEADETFKILSDLGRGQFMRKRGQPLKHSDLAPMQVGRIRQDMRR